MKTWLEFSVEKQEEKTGMDTDKDKERGESKEHRDKVKKAKEKMLDFFEKRKGGAKKIAQEARAKGGPSILTYWHFAAKDVPYREVIQAIKQDKDKSWFESKFRSNLSIIKPNMGQQKFQEVMGRLEVFGEAIAELF